MFQIPTLNELAERARQSFRANLPGSDAWVWPNNVYVSAKVIAGVGFEILGFASYISRQKFAVTAPDIESLRLHGEEFGIPQNPARPASGPVALSSAAAVSVDSGALLRRSDGATYSVVAGGSLPGAGSLPLDVVAVTPGKAGNAVPGTSLAVVSGVGGAGQVSVAVTGEGVTLGADVEDIESYRQRILFRKRNPPHGGAAADYVDWAGRVAGVSFIADRPTVFVERLWAGPGTVRVFPLMFDLYADGVPGPADVARVADYIDMVKPAGARVNVAAAVRVPVNIVISQLAPNTTEAQESVKAELREMFRRKSRVAGIDTAHPGMPFLASPVSFSRSWIQQAISGAAGEDSHVLDAPVADVPLQPGEIATLGTVSFV